MLIATEQQQVGVHGGLVEGDRHPFEAQVQRPGHVRTADRDLVDPRGKGGPPSSCSPHAAYLR